MLKLDPVATNLLIKHRVNCNKDVINHPWIVTDDTSLSMFGFLNGLVAPDKICYEVDDRGTITNFKELELKMNILIVAHPDDEALWFAPEKYDKIIIVFTGRVDDPDMKGRREKVMALHPLKDKIECWGLTESGYWRDKMKSREHKANYDEVCRRLRDVYADSVDTHDAYGEYGHDDHILVHNAVMATMDCPVNGKDPKIFRQIKNRYLDEGAWTWSR